MTEFLLLAFILLVAGVVSVPIASRFGLGSVLGYLLAGMALAPVLGVLGHSLVDSLMDRARNERRAARKLGRTFASLELAIYDCDATACKAK